MLRCVVRCSGSLTRPIFHPQSRVQDVRVAVGARWQRRRADLNSEPPSPTEPPIPNSLGVDPSYGPPPFLESIYNLYQLSKYSVVSMGNRKKESEFSRSSAKAVRILCSCGLLDDWFPRLIVLEALDFSMLTISHNSREDFEGASGPAGHGGGRGGGRQAVDQAIAERERACPHGPPPAAPLVPVRPLSQ